MLSLEKWEAISKWLIENKENLTHEEKEFWIEEFTLENDKILLSWSAGMDLLDDLKEELITNQPLFFNKDLEKTDGTSLFELGLFDKAIVSLKEELSQTNHPARLYLYLGFSYLYLSYEEDGREAFLNANQQSNDPLEKHFALLGLGLYAGCRGDIEEAITYFEKAEALLFNADLVYNLGICYLLLQMPKEAIPYFQKVTVCGEDACEASYWLGVCYMNCGDRESALEVWYDTIHSSRSEKILLSLATEFEERRLFTCAIYCYEKLAALGLNPIHVRHGILWNYGLMDEKEKVKLGFRQLLEQNPDQENVRISYLWLLHKWEDDDFQDEKNKAVEIGVKSPLLDMLT